MLLTPKFCVWRLFTLKTRKYRVGWGKAIRAKISGAFYRREIKITLTKKELLALDYSGHWLFLLWFSGRSVCFPCAAKAYNITNLRSLFSFLFPSVFQPPFRLGRLDQGGACPRPPSKSKKIKTPFLKRTKKNRLERFDDEFNIKLNKKYNNIFIYYYINIK